MENGSSCGIIYCCRTLVQFGEKMLKYEKIKEYLKEEALKPSAVRKMPTVRALSRQFSVATATVLRALQELEQENIICRRHGSGIVAVRPGSIDANLKNTQCNNDDMRRVVYAAVDYPSENIWRTNLMVEQTLQKYHYLPINCRILNNTTVSEICEFATTQKNCCGLILFGLIGMISPDDLGRISKLPFRVALLDHQSFSYPTLPENCALFSVDAASGAGLIVDYLTRLGHTRIGYVRNEPNSEYHEQFLKEFGSAMRRHKLEFGPRRIFSRTIRSWDETMSVAQQLVRSNLERIRSELLTALVFSSSHGAFAAIETLRESGFRVPEEISVIGEGDFKFFGFCSPPLTTVSADYLEMVMRMTEFIDGKPLHDHKIFLPLHLTERKSVFNLTYESQLRERQRNIIVNVTSHL